MEKDSTTDGDPSIGYLLHEVSRLMKRRFGEGGGLHRLPPPQWRRMGQIDKQQGISQVALAACIDTDPMTLSGVLDRLEKRGMIERYSDPNDSRAKLARLTPPGIELVKLARNVGRGVMENAMSGIAENERKGLAAHLARIRDNLNTMIAEQKEAV